MCIVEILCWYCITGSIRLSQKRQEAALLDARGAQEVLHSGIQTSQTNVAVQEANIAEAKS